MFKTYKQVRYGTPFPLYIMNGLQMREIKGNSEIKTQINTNKGHEEESLAHEAQVQSEIQKQKTSCDKQKKKTNKNMILHDTMQTGQTDNGVYSS